MPLPQQRFELDGSIIQPSPSPREMDALECTVRKQGGEKEVWVEFQNFYAGRPEPIAKG